MRKVFSPVFKSTFSERRRFGVFTGPIRILAPAITGTPEDGQTLTVDNGEFVGASPFTYVWRWLRGNTVISGAITSTYVLSPGDVGFVIRGQVRAIDAGGQFSAWITSNGLTILPNPIPTNALVNDNDEPLTTETLEILTAE